MSEFTSFGFSRGEQIMGLSWLSLGACLSLLLEVLYLGTWLTVGSLALPLPWTIPLAFLFNGVLTRTAKLWTSRIEVAAIPTIVWTIGFFLLLTVPAISGDSVLGENLRVLVLLLAGIVGGMLPLFRPSIEPTK